MTPRFNTYLPIIIHDPPRAKIGAQIEGDVSRVARWIVAGKVYQWSVKWRDWKSMRAVYDNNALLLSGNEQVITVKVCPEEYRLWPETAASPPREDCYDELAEFIQEVIDCYSPMAIEVFNEPDCNRSDAWAPEYFGAWVDVGEGWYEGGKRYGRCLHAIYPHIHDTKIIAGALMMHDGSLDFLHGAIDGGLLADEISYHAYIYSMTDKDRLYELGRNIKSLINLPIACTETSLLSKVESPAHMQAQADYLQYLIDNFNDGGVDFINWFTLANGGWMNSDLVFNDEPKPAYEIWRRA